LVIERLPLERTDVITTLNGSMTRSLDGSIAIEPHQDIAAGRLPSGERYLSLCSRPGPDRATAPIFHGGNPVGDALISTGIVDLAGASLAAMVPLLPVGVAGFALHEGLHRFDAVACTPSLEAGVVADNRVGEQLGTLAMRWLLAPDGFEASPSSTPPSTEIDPSRPQRFVMLDGRIQFQDRHHGVVRFFGAGRTCPATAGGRSRLLFAGTATVLEGAGSLEGLRGTLLITGEVTAPGAIEVVIVGRFDRGGPLLAADALGPMIEPAGGTGRCDQTVMVFTGEAAGGLHEQLRPIAINNDVGSAARLRCQVRAGAAAGLATGALAIETTDHRCSVRLAGSRRVLALSDPWGRRVASLTVDALDGTAFRDVRQGRPVERLIANGALSAASGSLAGAAGVVAFDTIAGTGGVSSSLYVVRLADPDRRFRAIFSEVFKPMAMLQDSAPAAGAVASGQPVQFVADDTGGRITDLDRAIIAHADRTLAAGIELQCWWEEKDAIGDYAERFAVVREFNQDDRSFGFFDRAPAGGRTIPVMGIVQEMFYDRQKHSTGEEIRAQLQEFVLRYFMRVSHLRQPEAVTAEQKAPRSAFERALSWLPDRDERRVGMGYQQLFYKLADTGEVGKFAEEERVAIVDLREVGPKYAWILLKVDIFDFNLSFAPFGAEAMKFQMPLKESTYLVLGPRFVKNRDNPAPGVLGEYGYGYAFVPYAVHAGGPIAYGPGHFAAAVQSVHFRLAENGEIRARAAFVVNRPDKIAKIDIDPIGWSLQMADLMTFNLASRVMNPLKAAADRLPLRVSGIDPIAAYIWMANTVTGGMAGKQLGISKEVLEKRMLVQHFMQHYAMLINSLLVWRLVPDWTDTAGLPEFCRQGIKC
jgi:hypothetical protein